MRTARVPRPGRRALSALLGALLALPLMGPVRAAAPTPNRTVVTILTLPHEGVADELGERLLRGLGRALARNKRLDLKDAAKLLGDFSGESPSDEVAAARQAAEQGQGLLAEVRPREAARKLSEAVRRLEQVLPYIHKQELAEAAMGLGVALALDGDTRGARTVFSELLVWRPRSESDATRIPPDIYTLYEEARREVARLPRGSVDIRSDPDGAQAFVDGRFVGVTPATAEGLIVGRHYVTLKKEGYGKAVVKAPVSPRRQEVVTQSLRRSEKYLLLQQSLERARAAFGEEKANDAMVDLRSFLFIDQVIFVRLAAAGDRVELQAALYDLRSRRRLSRVRTLLGPSAGEKSAEPLAENLYLGVPYDGSLATPAPEKPPEIERPRPFYAKWWFWTAIGVVATAAVVIPLEAQPDDHSTPGYRPAVIQF